VGRLDRADEADQTPLARAEGDLAHYLAQPSLFGIPPAAIELVDQRRQRWPGCDQPVDCFLFRYEFHLGERILSGIGMAGPILHAMRADLSDLSPLDIYAAYAGWCSEHAEIRELANDALGAAEVDYG